MQRIAASAIHRVGIAASAATSATSATERLRAEQNKRLNRAYEATIMDAKTIGIALRRHER
jgi:hypothetical protein